MNGTLYLIAALSWRSMPPPLVVPKHLRRKTSWSFIRALRSLTPRADPLGLGKLANTVFLSANPLEDIAAVRQVASTVKRGVQYQRKNYVPVTKAEVEGHL